MERLARTVTLVASLWFALAAFWEIAGPFGTGHVAASTSLGIAAENMFQWNILAPVLHYTHTQPQPGEYYCNHPWGIFWTTAVLVKLFGHHDWVCRLAPVLMSAATPPLLYAIGRALWGPVAGALCASSFAVLPIALAFANFNALEVPVIFGVLVASWGIVRFTQTWQRRWMVVSLAGLFHGINSDWPAFVFAAVALLLAVPRALLSRGCWFDPVDRRRVALWCALAVSICFAVVLFYHHRFSQADQLQRMLVQASTRAHGHALPLPAVLKSRAHWLEISFTPLAIFLGKLAVPVLLFRIVALRRDREALLLAVLAMAVVQYVVFKQGADVHIFWPHYFAPYFALALGALASSAEELTRAITTRLRGVGGPLLPPLFALGLCLPVPLFVLPDGVAALRYARTTGGRFNEKGLLIHQDVDKTTAMKWLTPQLEDQTSVGIHTSMKFTWSLAWALRRPSSIVADVPVLPATGRSQYFVADGRFATAKEQRQLAGRYHARVVGPFWMVDRAAPPAPIDGYSLQRREPGFFEWYFQQGNDPIMTVVADEHHTWELRHHFDQQPNPPPTAPATTREQQRISYNLAVASGDLLRAARLRHQIEGGLDRSSARDLSRNTRLLGTAFEAGVAPRLTVYFLAAGPTRRERQFSIKSRVEAKRWLSIVPPDRKERVVGMPFAIPPTLWKERFIYTSVTEIRQRPGVERFYGRWSGRRKRRGRRQTIDLLRLP